jgi:NAD(P)-dependent dehydrogenase (short-subunit alcohol dehydrogenase family)
MNKQTVIVTGASSGIGLAIAKAYLEQGFNVVGIARGRERLEAARRELGAPEKFFLGVEGDIGQPETAKKLFAAAITRFGKVDVLVNNAGFFNAKPFVDYSPEEIDAMVSTNLNGYVYAAQEAARHMIPQKEGRIINITASIAEQPLSNVPAALPILIKGGMNHLTKALALELAPHNIRVVAVAPGIIDTPMYQAEMHGFLKTLSPLGLIGTTKDVTDAVLYFTRASFATGVVLTVDGGMTTGRF